MEFRSAFGPSCRCLEGLWKIPEDIVDAMIWVDSEVDSEVCSMVVVGHQVFVESKALFLTSNRVTSLLGAFLEVL